MNRVKFLGPLMKNVVKTNEIARSLILHSTSPIAVKVCSSTLFFFFFFLANVSQNVLNIASHKSHASPRNLT